MNYIERNSLLAAGRKLAKEDATITPEQFAAGYKFWSEREKTVIAQGYSRAVRRMAKEARNG